MCQVPGQVLEMLGCNGKPDITSVFKGLGIWPRREKASTLVIKGQSFITKTKYGTVNMEHQLHAKK